MKKVFLMAALVLACTAGSNASAMSEAALKASLSQSMPVKKTTKKKTTTKKKATTSTTKKATTSTSTSASTSTKSAASNASGNAATSSNATSSSTGSTIANVLGGLLGGSTGNSNGSGLVNGILNNVIGSGTFKKEDLCHTWKYSKPGCAFTSENLLAKAGGEIAANKIENDLAKYYTKFGFNSSNTYFTFNTDGTFNAKIDGKAWNGNYTFDEKTHAIQLKGLILSMSGFATKTTSGISLLFEQKKLLTLIKTLSKLSGSSTLNAVGSIAGNYDGVRIGFEMTK